MTYLLSFLICIQEEFASNSQQHLTVAIFNGKYLSSNLFCQLITWPTMDVHKFDNIL